MSKHNFCFSIEMPYSLYFLVMWSFKWWFVSLLSQLKYSKCNFKFSGKQILVRGRHCLLGRFRTNRSKIRPVQSVGHSDWCLQPSKVDEIRSRQSGRGSSDPRRYQVSIFINVLGASQNLVDLSSGYSVHSCSYIELRKLYFWKCDSDRISNICCSY